LKTSGNRKNYEQKLSPHFLVPLKTVPRDIRPIPLKSSPPKKFSRKMKKEDKISDFDKNNLKPSNSFSSSICSSK